MPHAVTKPALVTLPSTASLEEMYEVIRRDGGVSELDWSIRGDWRVGR